METCKTIVLAQPQAGTSVNYEIPVDETAQLSFGPDSISGLRLNDFGGLEISFLDGATATLTNFQEMSDSGNLLYLNDGTLIDPSILMGAVGGLQEPAESLSDVITIVGPSDNVTREISLEPGQKYVLDLDFSDPSAAEIRDGALVISFDNEGTLVLKNYDEVLGGEMPAELSLVSGETIISGEELLASLQVAQLAPASGELEIVEEDAEEEPQEDIRTSEVLYEELQGPDAIGAGNETGLGYEIASIEPAAGEDSDLDSVAEALQNVEPAAGDTGGAAGGRGGFGFGSVPGSEPLSSPNDVGPINPTQLAYDAPEPTIDRLALDEEAPDFRPIITEPIRSELDESTLDGGNLVDTGTVPVDFGGDGPGTITPNGEVTVECSTPTNQLFSGGQEVTIAQTSNGYEGLLPNGTIVFTLVIDPASGDYTYTQIEPFDHSDPNDPNDEICLNFGVVATDADGDQTTTQIEVIVADDAPEILEQTIKTLDEDSLDGGPAVLEGTFNFDVGQDVAGTVTPNGQFDSKDAPNDTLTSGGEIVNVTPTDNGYVGKLPDGTVVFELTVDPTDGDYTFTQFEPLDHNDPNDPDETVTLEFGVTVTDFDGDRADGTITINVKDSAPTFEAPVSSDIDETNKNGGSTSVTGTLPVDFGQDGGSLAPTGTFTPGGSMTDGTLTSGGLLVTVTPTDNGYEGKLPDGTVVFDLTVNPQTGDYTFTQNKPLDHADGSNPNDVITLNFGIVATDADGDQAVTSIIINVSDDAPIVGNPASETLDESDLGPLTETGRLDVDFGEDGAGTIAPNNTFTPGGSLDNNVLTSGGLLVTVTATDNGYEGKLPDGTVVFDLTVDPTTGDYSFTLKQALDHADDNNPNDIITLKFGIDATDSDGDSVSTEIIINIKDDAPVLQPNGPKPDAGLETVDESDLDGNGNLVETGSLDADFGQDAPGSYAFTQDNSSTGSRANNTLSSNGSPVSVSANGNTYTGTTATGIVVFTLTLDPTTGDYTYTQFEELDHANGNNPDDVITLNFGVAAIDSEGESVFGQIQINVRDDAATAKDDLNTYDTNNGGASGNVITGENGGAGAADDLSQDVPNTVVKVEFEGNTVQVPQDGSDVTIEGEFGTLTINKDGEYTYDIKSGINVGAGDGGALNPTAGDVAGTQSSLTKDGITVTSANGEDLTWVSKDGAGIGIAGGSDKVWPSGERLELTFAKNISSIELTIADIGANNLDDGIDYAVYLASDPSKPIYGEIAIKDVQVVDGKIVFTLNASDFGDGAEITQVDLFSTDAGHYGPASFLLNNVCVEYVSLECIEDEFVYTLQDGDGDQSEATLMLRGKDLVDDVPVIVDPAAKTIDETDLGPKSVSGSISVDYFSDTPGEITPNGSFTPGGSLTNNALTHQGIPVNVVANGNTYTGTANGTTVFTLVVNENGDYKFTLFDSLDHGNVNNPDDVITLDFGVTATDADGDTDTTIIRINVKDDGPMIEDKVGQVFEDDLEFGPISTTRDMNFDFGEDGPGEIGANGTFQLVKVMGGSASDDLTSGGKSVNVTKDGNGYVGKVGNTTVFTLTIDPATGTHTYTQFEPLDHFEGHNPADDVFWLKFGVDIVDADGDTDTAFIIVDVHDGEPMAENDIRSLTESDGTTSGNLLGNDHVGPDTPGSVDQISFNGNTFAVPATGSIQVQGTYGLLTISANGGYSYTLNADHVPDTAMDQFGYVMSDADGDTDEAILKINITGTDTIPVIVDPSIKTVDETDLGPDRVSGSLDVDFVSDDPGSIEPNGIFTSEGSRANNTLTHKGIPVHVNADGDTYTGTANGTTVFTLVVGENGDYEFTLFEVLDHGNPNNPDDVITLNFGVTATDGDGDKDTATIRINVKDDGPVIEDTVGQVFEVDLENGPISVTRDVSSFDFGEDGAGAIEANGTFQLVKVMGGSPSNDLTSGGHSVNVTKDGNGYIGKAGNTTVFTLTIDPATGTHTYTQFKALDHFEGHNPADDVFWLKFGVDISDHDGDTDSAFIIVDVHDDEPVIADKFGQVFESGLKDGPITTTRKMDYDFGQDGRGDIRPTGDVKLIKVMGTNEEGPITSGGQSVHITTTANGYQGMVGTVLVFTLSIDPANGTHTYTQYEPLDHFEGHNPADDVFWLKFGVEITDADGDTDTAFIIVDVHDAEPVAHTDVNVFDGNTALGNVLVGTNGGDNAADLHSPDDPTLVTHISFGNETKSVTDSGTVIRGEYGQLEIESDGDYKYVADNTPVTPEKQTLYTYEKSHPDHNNTAGYIKYVKTTYNDTTHEFTFEVVIKDPHNHLDNDGFTLALNDGPNPKGIAGELAILYFDDTGHEPVVTVYGYNGENTQTSYRDGSPANGTQAPDQIASSLQADNPFTSITKSINSSGYNVYKLTMDATSINDYMPKNADGSDWTGIEFGEKLGIWMHPVANLHTDYDHNGYLTEWNPEATGWYDTTNLHTHVEEICPCEKNFNPDAHDLSGHPSSLTLDGITVRVGNPQFGHLDKGQLNWTDTHDGSGIGIYGNGSDKVWQPGETLQIEFHEDTNKATLKLADIGSNNMDDGIDFKIYLDGQSHPVAYEFDIGQSHPQNGYIEIEIDAAQFGGHLIDQIEIFSVHDSHLGTASFLLNSVHAVCPPDKISGTDVFEYKIADADGDTSSAYLVFNGGNGEAVTGTKLSDTLTGTSQDDAIFGDAGNDVLYGGSGADTFLFVSLDHGRDTIKDFNSGEGDTIDLSKLLEEYDPVSDAIEDFVYISSKNGDTEIAVDVTGSGNVANAQTIANIQGQQIDLSDLLGSENLIV